MISLATPTPTLRVSIAVAAPCVHADALSSSPAAIAMLTCLDPRSLTSPHLPRPLPSNARMLPLIQHAWSTHRFRRSNSPVCPPSSSSRVWLCPPAHCLQSSAALSPSLSLRFSPSYSHTHTLPLARPPSPHATTQRPSTHSSCPDIAAPRELCMPPWTA